MMGLKLGIRKRNNFYRDARQDFLDFVYMIKRRKNLILNKFQNLKHEYNTMMEL
jgi:hypothetical protein